MLKTLRISFSLKNTYRVNGILYAIKQIPGLRKIIPDQVYGIWAFKVLATVISVIWEVISAFLGKLIYFLLLLASVGLYELAEDVQPTLFLHIFIPLSLIGAFMNTYMFDPTKDKYYAMILLGMNAKQYTLVNYFYAIAKLLVGFCLFGLIFGQMLGLLVWECLLLPLFVAGLKLMYAASELREYEKKGTANNENKLKVLQLVLAGGLLLAAFVLPLMGVMLPRAASVALMWLPVVFGLISLRKILIFSQYRPMYQEILTVTATMLDPSAQKQIQAEYDQKNISADTNIRSEKKGFEYLNELFVKRHQKILWKSAKKISIVCLIVIVVVLFLFYMVPDLKDGINRLLMESLPYFVFIMYMLNRGTGFTRALFVNCDHSLLTFSFYKEPKQILWLFRIRLWEIIKVNLLPATVIGTGLAIWLFASGGAENPLNYAVLFVSVVALSVFFSVHYLTLYYLLQPYNAGSEIKGGMYQVAMWVTYVVCYVMIKIELPTFGFGLATIAFCLLYCGVACLLVYKIAPKTFKIR